MPLGKITETDHDACSKNLGRCRIPAKGFDEKLQAKIVNGHTSHHHQEIAE